MSAENIKGKDQPAEKPLTPEKAPAPAPPAATTVEMSAKARQAALDLSKRDRPRATDR